MNVGLLQLFPYNFDDHIWNFTAASVMIPQHWKSGSPQSIIHYIQCNTSTSPVLHIFPEYLIVIHLSTPETGLVPPSLTNITDIIFMERNQSFILFVLCTLCIEIQAMQICFQTCSIPWSCIDTPISFTILRQFHTIPWLNFSVLNCAPLPLRS